MTYKIIKSTDNPVVATYMKIIESGFLSKGLNFEVIDEKDTAAIGTLKKSRGDVLVVDSPLVSLKYKLQGFDKFIIWFQGVLPEESYMKNNSRLRAFVLGKIEKYFLKKSKLLFFVSNEMLEHYEKKYKLSLGEKAIIMPCFNETQIEEQAFECEKYKENTFLYAGGLQVWQCFEQTAQLYAEVERRAKKKTKLYVYTFQKELAEEIIKKYGVQNYMVDCVDKEELSQRIKGIKYGFVLREDSVVNNVSTPTKLSNYLANGIIPIYSSAIKSFAKYDEGNKLGLVCELGDLSSGVEKILLHMQSEVSADEVEKKCRKAFSDYYNADVYIEMIAERLAEVEK